MTASEPALAAVPPALRDAILAWYDAVGREIPFRGVTDPYAILVSELMAQQTQVARAAEAWQAWMARFPTVETLAAAPAADVLRAWAGLGYNRRAVQLHRAAKMIVETSGGRVPDTVEGLLELPGVGPYTARAVAAIAFGRPVGAVDTNVRRVLGRIVAGGAEGLPDAGGAEGLPAARLQAIADAVVPAARAGDWTHALMDVGARLCRPRRPRCADCPAVAWCRYAAGEPVRPPSGGRAAATRAARTRAARTRATQTRAAPTRAARARAAGLRAAPARPGRREPAFPSTSRWLRGRILAQALDAPDGSWTAFADPIGSHQAAAVREALAAMASDGLLELRDGPAGPEARPPGG